MVLHGTWAKNSHSLSRHMIINLNFDPSQVQRSAHFKVQECDHVCGKQCAALTVLLFTSYVDQCDKIYLSNCS